MRGINRAKALQEIKNMDDTMISPAQAARVIGCNPAYIRIAARENPKGLGFDVMVYGSRTKIPRIPFIQYIEGGNANCL